uniref:Tick transposon n=1 Tax=Rhipicephalus appendiculatus TaxID=34631 RepID=A0A131YD33_RHIAP
MHYGIQYRFSIYHAQRAVLNCVLGVVYMIPLGCGGVYIGQSGCCINVRLREHRSSGTSHLAMHCWECGCCPVSHGSEVVFSSSSQVARGMAEVFHMGRGGDRCVRRPSVLLLEKGFFFP